jgi:hypothetical protein
MVRKSIKISSAKVNFEEVVAVSVVAIYRSPDGSIVERFDETLEAKGSLNWEFDVRKRDVENLVVDWKATYFLVEGEHTEAGKATGSFISLPAGPA